MRCIGLLMGLILVTFTSVGHAQESSGDPSADRPVEPLALFPERPPPIDLDVIAAEEFVREIRESADPIPVTAPRAPAGEFTAGALTIADLIRLTRDGVPPAEQDLGSDSGDKDGDDPAEDGEAADE